MSVPEPVLRWANLPGPSALLAAVHRRARRGQRTESGALPALAFSHDQRNELAQLLGTGWELSGRPVRLQDLAARLAEHGLSVLDLVETVGGPVEEDRAVRDRASAAAAAERDEGAAVLAGCGIGAEHAASWLADAGLPKPGNGELSELASRVALVWASLPVAGTIHLAQLAAGTMHDAHALDADRTLGRAVARLAATVHGLDRPQRAGRSWREAWAAAGVRCDAVSSRVLVLNLPLRGDAPAARLCAAAPGEPLWLTLRSLAGPWSAEPSSPPVFICENPTVVETAAGHLGPACPPMICTDGIASGAALDLIAGLAAAGVPLHVRADIDPAGFTIVDQVRSAAPHAAPWRFDTPTYAAALGLPAPLDKPANLDASLRQLRTTYAEHNAPLHEERLLDHLLSDLRAATDRGEPLPPEHPTGTLGGRLPPAPRPPYCASDGLQRLRDASRS